MSHRLTAPAPPFLQVVVTGGKLLVEVALPCADSQLRHCQLHEQGARTAHSHTGMAQTNVLV